MTQFNYSLSAIVAGICLSVLFLGNSGGAAANDNFYTGAPSTGGGTEATCSTCHRGGTYGEPALTVLFAEQGSTEFNALTSYVPGQTYQVSIKVGFTGAEPAGYGFQAQFLTDSTALRAGTATATGGVQVSAGGAARQYVEHNSVSNGGDFAFAWTAPEVGTGPVNLYAVGNLVNRARGTGGDNGSTSPTIVALTEGNLSSVATVAAITGRLYPNPAGARSRVQVEVDVKQSGSHRLTVRDATGRLLTTAQLELSSGGQVIPLMAENFSTGLYTVLLTGSDSRFVGRLVVR
ncbi:choice-of-anchor V domain-containing protein [Neolewinella antarctica]|uniref:T9SS type A sorting domain-containing protein n=1 Tax=Neolewinella antarctica TaxID=442734 RepID=A0ABX0XC24_9BACT|nr:choice-of-anchor V domain-containing protein [Neolewinella antarctica]NJC26526.1 hypothetical protein [Neolewinella antarctica]